MGAREDVAGQLAGWLGTVDAVHLGRALHAIESMAPGPGTGGALDIAMLEARFERAKADMTALITAPPAAPKPLRERADNTPPPAPDLAQQAEFSFHAPRYLALQKQMEARLPALRVQVRQQLAHGSPALRQLAALDAAMEPLMAAREQRLWATLPVHLDRRLAHQRQAHQQRLAALGHSDDPARWQQPGGWLHAFERDLQALLLAEMHVRLQPTLGLLEAARNENMERQE